MEDAPELFVTPESEQSEAVAVSGKCPGTVDPYGAQLPHREIYLQIIDSGEARRLWEMSKPWWPTARGSHLRRRRPFRLIANVVDNGGIHWYEVDAQGDEITEERRANLTDDEADDLVEGFALEALMRDVRSWSAWLPNVVCVTCSTRRPAALAPIWTLSISRGEPPNVQGHRGVRPTKTDAGALIGASGQPLQPKLFRGHAGTLRRPGMG